MTVFVFVNEEARMTAKIIAATEKGARKLLPPGIEWTLE